MSGGSLDYLYSHMNQYDSYVFDEDYELKQLYNDFTALLHDYEWYTSGDYGEGTWNESCKNFKDKWLRGSVKDRIGKMIDERLEDVKLELHKCFDESDMCGDCVNFNLERNSKDYGICSLHFQGASNHRCDFACSDFEDRSLSDA